MNENSFSQLKNPTTVCQKAYVKKHENSSFFTPIIEIITVFITVLGTILCSTVLAKAAPMLIQGSICGLVFALPFLYFAAIGKSSGKVYEKSSVRLLLTAFIGLIAVFILNSRITAVLGGIYLFFEDDIILQIIPKNSFITGMVLCFLFTVLIYTVVKVIKSVPLVIAVTFVTVLQSVVFEYYTESIPNIFGIFILISSYVLLYVYSYSNTPFSFAYAIIACVFCSTFGILSVYELELERPYIIENGSSFLRGEQKLSAVNIPYIPMRDIWDNKPNSMTMLEDKEHESILYADGKFEFNGIDALRVTMDFGAFDGNPVYLRHFFGADYNGFSWTELSDVQKQTQSEVISEFTTSNLTPENFDSYFYQLINSEFPDETVNFEFYIKNVGVNTQTPFLPYFLSNYDESYNNEEITNNNNNYSGDVTMPRGFYDNKAFVSSIINGSSASQNSNFQSDELNYRSFVYANFMNVSAEFIAENPVLGSDYMEYITAEASQNGKSTLTEEQVFVRKINFIHNWLRDNCEYNINVGEIPSDKDFALYFLNENREGFCQHFATAATLLCRAAGIPSRYVTGFIVAPADYATPAPDGSVIVKDSRAHAWTEVYVNGYGWMPLDFTSGYSNVRTSLTAAQKKERSADSDYENFAADPIAENPQNPVSDITPTESPKETPSAEADNNNSRNSQEKVENDNFEHQIESKVSYLRIGLITLFVIISIAAVLFLRHVVSRRKVTKKLQSENAFEFILKRTKFILNASGLSTAYILSDSRRYMETLKNNYEMVTPIIEKAILIKFGNETATENDIKELNSHLDSAIKTYYSRQKPLKRFWLQYILNVL
jgi:transglutaminase-like putative cysteine protease